MIYATLSADIVKSTSLSTKDTFRLRNYLQLFINKASFENKGVWGRIIKGDELELVATNPNSIILFFRSMGSSDSFIPFSY